MRTPARGRVLAALLTSIAGGLAGCVASVPQALGGAPGGPAIQITPRAAQARPGDSVTFSAVPSGAAAGAAVEWSVSEASGGSIDALGHYLAPQATGTYHVVARLAADPSVQAVATVTVWTAPAGEARLGINLYDVSDWAVQFLFANIAMEGRVDGTGGPGDGGGPFDADRWPSSSSFQVMCDSVGKPGSAGTYALRFRGRASVSPRGATGSATYHSGAGDPDQGWTTGSYVKATDGASLSFSFSGATRSDGSPGVTDLEILRPGEARGAAFSKELLARLSHFKVVRTMQLLGGPGPSPQQMYTDVTWSDRMAPGPGTRWDAGPWGNQYARKVPPYDAANGKGHGPSLEWAIELANQAHVDLWLNVGFYADDEYVRNMALALKYGTDGVNPYTSPQASPAWRPLDPGLRVYVEYFNEVWNYKEDENAALAAGAPAALHLEARYGGYDRVGFMAVRNSLVFRSVFGDGDMMTRVRPVLAGQMALLDHVKDGASYIQRVWGPGNAYGYPGDASGAFSIENPGAPYGTAGQPVSWYLWAISGAPYIQLGSGTDVIAQMQQTLDAYLKPRFDEHEAYAASLGVKMTCYEGGFEIPANAATTAALSDPRLTGVLLDYLGYFFSKPSSDAFMYYALVTHWGAEQYGLSGSTVSEATPAWDAILQVAAAQ
jgi:hypothetical protein